MNRRAFFTGLGAVLAAPVAAEAQQAGKVPRVGLLCAVFCGVVMMQRAEPGKAFLEALALHGYEDGRNIIIDERWAGVPVGALREKGCGSRAATDSYHPRSRKCSGRASRAIGDLDHSDRHGRGWQPHGLLLLDDSVLYRGEIWQMALMHRLPTLGLDRQVTRAGGLMSYGPSRTEMYAQSAEFIDRILRGTPPAELPVQEPRKYEFLINAAVARAIGLTIPPSLLLRADQVIE
jgi:ABC transporter substrate binding protein